MNEITKDPDAALDYGLDWSAWLQAGETIINSAWLVSDSTLVLGSSSNDGTTTVVWLSGGQVRSYPYTVTNRITTSAGRVDDRSFLVHVAQR